MTYKIVIRPIAFIDIDEAVAWYEKELKGLGKRFVQNLEQAFSKLQYNPQHYLSVYGPVRRILLKKFPYKIFYLVDDNNCIVILAVLHIRKSKRFIKERLKK